MYHPSPICETPCFVFDRDLERVQGRSSSPRHRGEVGPTAVESASAPRFVGGQLEDTPVRGVCEHLPRPVRSGAECTVPWDVASLRSRGQLTRSACG